nr:protein FAM207A [Vicugna pacos]
MPGPSPSLPAYDREAAAPGANASTRRWRPSSPDPQPLTRSARRVSQKRSRGGLRAPSRTRPGGGRRDFMQASVSQSVAGGRSPLHDSAAFAPPGWEPLEPKHGCLQALPGVFPVGPQRTPTATPVQSWRKRGSEVPTLHLPARPPPWVRDQISTPGERPGVPETRTQELAFPSAGVFAGTTIEPGALVQKLDEDVRSRASTRREIEAIKLAEQKRKAERRRRATVVVGDLQPLRDALPELLELEAGSRRLPARRRAASRPRPAELSRMNAAQRLQLLEEERTRFQELLASPAYRASPLLAIGRQLAQQMQLDGSQP